MKPPLQRSCLVYQPPLETGNCQHKKKRPGGSRPPGVDMGEGLVETLCFDPLPRTALLLLPPGACQRYRRLVHPSHQHQRGADAQSNRQDHLPLPARASLR